MPIEFEHSLDWPGKIVINNRGIRSYYINGNLALRLSNCEFRALKYRAMGFSNQETADRVSRSSKTIKLQLRNACRRNDELWGVHPTVEQLIIMADRFERFQMPEKVEYSVPTTDREDDADEISLDWPI